MKIGKIFAAVIVALALLSGCAQVHEATESAREENSTREASIRRIIVSSESGIPAHPSFERLGPVGGHCAQSVHSDDEVPFADTLRRSAYLKFGEQADGVIEARAWFISHSMPSSTCLVSGDPGGEYYCCGVAVHFLSDGQ